MKIPHVSDYYVGGVEELLDIPTRLCVIHSTLALNDNSNDKKDNSYIIIRRICHLGSLVWLGIPRRIKAISVEQYEKDGPIYIMTHNNQYVVPKQSNSFSNVKIVLTNKRIYNVKPKDELKEIVIKNNKPIIKNYKLKEYKSLSDEGRVIKGYLTTRLGDELLVF